jgi:hypothetical protein
VQNLIVGELSGMIARGMRPGLGVLARIPVRLVRDRVRYEDLARQPYAPPNPDLHHRNETISGLSDPQLFLHAARGEMGAWQFAGKAGVSIPVGKTEPNPFLMGRQGLPHQHVQLGTGTWDPILEAGVGRPFGALDVRATGIARFSFEANGHGYQAGNRYALLLDASHWPSKVWGAEAGVALLREEAETWDGRLETEGNLGRVDVLLALGVIRTGTSFGTVNAGVQLSVHSHTQGHHEQMDIPLIVRVGWSP